MGLCFPIKVITIISKVACVILNIFFAENYWTDLDNRRKLFIDIAHKMGFDPLKNPEKWRSVSRASLSEFKVQEQKNLLKIYS